MRLFIVYPDQTGTRKTMRITVNCTSTSQFLKTLAGKLQLPKRSILVNLKYESFSLRIVDGWPISHYPIKNGSKIEVAYNEELLNQQEKMFTPKTLQKIEEDVINQMELNQFSEEDQNQGQTAKLSFISENGDYDWNKYFDESLQLFLNAVRSGQLEKVAQVLRMQPKVKSEQQLADLQSKKLKYLINQLGQCGRSALHWSIHIKNIDIMNFLIIKSCSLSVLTIDGSTPLQLAIELNFEQGINTLLTHPNIDINQQTSKGSALHTAAIAEDTTTIKKLLGKGIDTRIKNDQGKTAADVASNKSIQKLLQQSHHKANPIKELPYILKGDVYRVSSISRSLSLRELLINPFTGQLKVLNKKEVDKKTRLLDVTDVFIIDEKGWFMDKKFNYFQIQTRNSKLTFAAKHLQIAQRWIEMAIRSIQFYKSNHTNAKFKDEQQLIEYIDDKNNDIRHHKRKVSSSHLRPISIMNLKVSDQPQEQQQAKVSTKNSPIKKQEPKPQILKSDIYGLIEDSSTEKSIMKNEENYRDSEIMLGSILGEKSLIFPQTSRFTINNADFQAESIRSSQAIADNPQIFQRSSYAFQINDSQLKNQVIQEKNKLCFKDFDIIKLLGNGSFGKVFLARHRKKDKVYALKVLNKKKLTAKKHLRYAVSEANILKRVNSPFIIKLYSCFQTPTNLYMALDYCPNSDLSQLLNEKESLSEQTARFIIAQLIEAIDHLHSLSIIYRDLKPENILMRENGYVCLADFGLSRERTFSKSFCGSPAYLSPEMLDKKGVGVENDIYGIGCVLYEMLVGQPPYFDQDIDKLFENIRSGRLRFPSHLSKSAKSLINGLLERNISKRIGVKDKEQIRNHGFFSKFDWQKLRSKQLSPPKDLISDKTDELKLEAVQNHGFDDTDYVQPHSMINRIKNFSFSRDSQEQLKISH